ncbi:GH3 auxin-responsive promoter-domain-containing protein [Phlebopus sp. FC_14]|nr:GH3 auxin-responsive promoter-domain-containing protein [Phlebopus sp. FC_14]
MADPLRELLPSLPAPLRGQLEAHGRRILTDIIKVNTNSQYALSSPVLADFRSAIGLIADHEDDGLYLKTFRQSVPLSVYDDYKPYCCRFFEKPCKESDVRDLLSPGIPDFLFMTSATSGNECKYIPRFRYTLPGGRQASSPPPQPPPVLITSWLRYVGYREIIDVKGDNGQCMANIKVCSGTAATIRRRLGLYNDDEDETRMGRILSGHVTPFAASFIAEYRTFLLIHGLFSMANRDLEVFDAAFIGTFADLIQCIDDDYTVLLGAIEKGVIPAYEGLDNLLSYLETNLSPNPERAAELRDIGAPSRAEGWAGRAFPKLKKITGVTSGAFAQVIPKVKWWLGPNCDINTTIYASTEGHVGIAYNPTNLNQYRIMKEDYIEFLDISTDEQGTNLSAPWEVQVGRQYEVILTTRDGLWRYRLDDVVEILGFTSQDGIPIIKYIGSRSGDIKLSGTITSETHLKEAILAAQDALGPIYEFTVARDERLLAATFGYFVELAGQLGLNPETAPQQVLDSLLILNPELRSSQADNKLRKPTIRIVKPGTFMEMRRWKANRGSGLSIGLIKTPLVFSDELTKEWIEKRVVQEI